MTQDQQWPPATRFLLPTLLVLNGLLLPCSCCLLASALIDPHNPMLLVFITDIQITNATHETLKVTPIGTYGSEGQRDALPIYRTREAPAYPSSQRGGFVVESGRTIEILYEWDDINLSEIVVETASGQLGQIVTDPNPTANQYHQPDPNHFVVDDVAQLQPVPADVLGAFHEAQQPYRRWRLYAIMLAPWVCFVALLMWWLRLRNRQAAPQTQVNEEP